MLYEPPRKRRTKAVVVSAFAVVALMLGVAAWSWRKPRPAANPAAQPDSPVHSDALGWRIMLTTAGPQHFSGVFAPGQELFVPAGTEFRAAPMPSDAPGMFSEAFGSSGWDHNGGELNPPMRTPGGFVQECRAPGKPGLYQLAWLSNVVLTKSCNGSAGLRAGRDAGATIAELIQRNANERGAAPALNIIVLARAETSTQGGRTTVKVNGKSIGAYHDPLQAPVRRVRENAQFYQPPLFFAPLTQETAGVKLGPDFDLGQLVAFKDYHGPDGKKVYTTDRHTDIFPPRPELIDKLVKLRDRLRSKGVNVTRFWLTSAFRTPDYNHSIGGAAYSRHCYGDAVDLVIDEDNDKRMDDLNGDGRIDRKDGILIGNACRELELEGAVVPGGIGVYEWDSDDSVRSHVHIDCRGYISRWGQIGAGRYKKTFLWWPKAEFQEEDSGE